jgi:hypothetical protein
MRKVETIEIYKEKSEQTKFDYQIKYLIEHKEYELLEKTNDYAKLITYWDYAGE